MLFSYKVTATRNVGLCFDELISCKLGMMVSEQGKKFGRMRGSLWVTLKCYLRNCLSLYPSH